MRKCNLIIVLFINLGSLLFSIACPNCPQPSLLQPQKWKPKLPHFPFSPKKHPPKVKPPLDPNPSTKVPVPLPPIAITKSPPPSPASHHLPIRPIITLPPPPQSPPPQLSPPAPQKCHVDPFKLGACVDLLGGLVHLRIGRKVKEKCCPLLEVLVDIEAAFCLCSVMKKKFGKASLVIPITLEFLASCDKSMPSGFHCMA